MDQNKFEDTKQILGWRDMEPGHWYFIDKEVAGLNKYMKPISVVTIKLKLGGPSIKFYALLHCTMGLKTGRTRRSSGMNASLYRNLATNAQNSSTLLNLLMATLTFKHLGRLKKKFFLSFEINPRLL